MPQQAWNAKRERQYEHIKDSLEDQGTSKGKAKEIAARTVNKERARSGRGADVVATVPRGHLIGPARRAPLRHAPRQGTHARPALRRGQEHGRQGPLEDDEGSIRRAVDGKKR